MVELCVCARTCGLVSSSCKQGRVRKEWIAEAGYWVEVKLTVVITTQDEFSESVQISPQEIRLHLRTGIHWFLEV